MIFSRLVTRPASRYTRHSRTLAFKPRVESLTSPKPPSATAYQVPNDPAVFQNFLKSYAPMTEGIDDSIAMQIFTHKSFAHGKSPYNEKLVLVGKQVLKYRLSTHLMTTKTTDSVQRDKLASLCDIGSITHISDSLPELTKLLRWKPKDPKDLEGSGQRKIAADTIFAIIGALELRSGAAVAANFVQEKIIPALIKS